MERFVDVPGGRLFVVDEGDGPPVVLLHAGIVDLRSWDGLVPHLVAAGYRAVRYDARAWGRSTTEDVAYSNRADLVAVLDALGIGRAALVGNSRGGQIAFDTAVEFPDRVVAVVGVGRRPRRLRGPSDAGGDRPLRGDGAPRGGRAQGRRGDHRRQHPGLGRRARPAAPAGRRPGSPITSARRASSSRRPTTSSGGRSCSTRRRRRGSPTCAARSSRSPGRSTSPTWPRRRATWRRTPRTRGPSSSRTSPT